MASMLASEYISPAFTLTVNVAGEVGTHAKPLTIDPEVPSIAAANFAIPIIANLLLLKTSVSSGMLPAHVITRSVMYGPQMKNPALGGA
ncbi:hypothetical protein WI75_08475 [Burkholderia ubonensis]|nr:hypothetical protein WI75_08475 [Burkholderia ubonensis]